MFSIIKLEKELSDAVGRVMRAHLFIAGLAAATALPAIAQTNDSNNSLFAGYRGPEWYIELNSLRVAWAIRKSAIVRGLDERREVRLIDSDATLVQLDPDTSLVTEDKSDAIFIVSRKSGKYAVIWDGGDEIEGVLDCSTYQGEFLGKVIGRLPDTAGGDHRFYVVDTGCLIAGAQFDKYLSIMELHGTNVIEKLRGKFQVNANYDTSGTVDLRGNVLHIPDWHNLPPPRKPPLPSDLFPDGALFDWQIQLGPTDVKDLGRIPPQAR